MQPLRFHPLDYATAVSFVAYSSSAVVTPIALVILARELNFGLADGGTLEVMRGTLIVAVLLTSGFLAGRWSKAKLLGVSSLLLGAGLFFYGCAPSYAIVLIAMGLLGVGGGVIEGLINPLVQDLHPDDSGRYLNIANGFWSIGVLLTVLLGGELLTYDPAAWRWLVSAVGALSVVAGLLFFALAGRGPRGPDHAFSHVLEHKRDILGRRRFWVFASAMFLGGGVEGGFTFWIASYVQLHFDALPRAGGIGTACFAAGMIFGRFGAGWWVSQHRLAPMILGSAVAGIVVSLVVPALPSLAMLYPALALAGVTVACFWPSIQSYAADRLPVESTSLFILLSCAGIPGFAFASWLMGVVGDAASLQASFFILPVMLALLATVMVVERRRGRG